MSTVSYICYIGIYYNVFNVERYLCSLIVRYKCEAKKARYPLGAKFGCDPQSEAPALMLLAKALNLSVVEYSAITVNTID